MIGQKFLVISILVHFGASELISCSAKFENLSGIANAIEQHEIAPPVNANSDPPYLPVNAKWKVSILCVQGNLTKSSNLYCFEGSENFQYPSLNPPENALPEDLRNFKISKGYLHFFMKDRLLNNILLAANNEACSLTVSDEALI